MQRHGILNSHIAKVLADLGHTDTICISDCGLPVPEGVQFLEFTFPSDQYKWIETSHEAFKEATKQCKCIIRTGEASPYANIILRADCIFSNRP
ncbi:MAG: RbsD/FucU domain-containing protein [Veillonella sp.]|nr:RbsD/FucU domain-containing protein [Veillonella sp.]